MSTNAQKKIDLVNEFITSSDYVDEYRKDVLRILLEKTEIATNGDDQAQKLQYISEAFQAFILDYARESVRGPFRLAKEVANAIDEHVRDCPLQIQEIEESLKHVKDLPVSSKRLAHARAWVDIFNPLRWPVTIVVVVVGFAPQADRIISLLRVLLFKEGSP